MENISFEGVYLDRKVVFADKVDTTLRPDMVPWSRQARTTIAIELTISWEKNFDKAKLFQTV